MSVFENSRVLKTGSGRDSRPCPIHFIIGYSVHVILSTMCSKYRSKTRFRHKIRRVISYRKNFLKKLKKHLQFTEAGDKILKYVYCTYWYWYAMMREVAALRGGEFPRSMSDLQTGRLDNLSGAAPFAAPCYRIVFSCAHPENIVKYFRFFKRSGWKHPGLLKQKNKARHYIRAERLKIQKGV